MKRKELFVKNTIFHIFNRSISNYKIFHDKNNARRFIEVLDYNNNFEHSKKFSSLKDDEYLYQNIIYPREKSLIKFICYCIMPDHYHLVVKINKENILSKYLGSVECSFTKYFNLKFNRRGPLWENRFQAVKIKNNEQLLHVSRYVHLNPTSSNLVKKPEDWSFSSYQDFITDKNILNKYIKEISISSPTGYKKFVENNKDYQKKLKEIRKLLHE
jgi:putative transposase